MTITFNCPNGHKLTAPEQQSGKPGKCPKCAAVFRVPEPAPAKAEAQVEEPPEEEEEEPNPFDFTRSGREEEPEQESAEEAADDRQNVAEGESDEQPSISEGPAEAGMIVFLCPNGHRLHGPASLVGRPGQCPHCEIRFLIPSPEDVPEEDEEEYDEKEHDISLDELLIQIDTSKPPSSPSMLGKHSAPPPPPPAPSNAHPLSALFARLWAQKGPGRIVELHLGDGKVLLPDQYSAANSQRDHGLFALKEANGSYTVTAVAWDSIQRVAIRGLDQLPAELFHKT